MKQINMAHSNKNSWFANIKSFVSIFNVPKHNIQQLKEIDKAVLHT